MTEQRPHDVLLIILFVVIFFSIGITYYKYMIQKDFTYFTDEESIPSIFDINSYK